MKWLRDADKIEIAGVSATFLSTLSSAANLNGTEKYADEASKAKEKWQQRYSDVKTKVWDLTRVTIDKENVRSLSEAIRKFYAETQNDWYRRDKKKNGAERLRIEPVLDNDKKYWENCDVQIETFKSQLAEIK
jgi:hypothetical protein